MSDLPRVTQILSDLGFTRYFGNNDRAMSLGRAVHKAIHYDCKGTLDWASLHPDLAGPMAAYQKLRQHARLTIEATEFELIHPTWQYIGHPDAVGRVGVDSVFALIDWKVSDAPDLKTATLQLAAYRLAYEAVHQTAIGACYVGRLGKDGSFSLPDVTSSEAMQQFQACVIVWRALQERGKV